MKICISGKTTSILYLVKFIKEITNSGLKESKELVDTLLNGKSIILEVQDYNKVKKKFDECGFESDLTLKKHRKEEIIKFLIENDTDFDNTKDLEYEKYLKAFNMLFRYEKNTLKIFLNHIISDSENLKDLKL